MELEQMCEYILCENQRLDKSYRQAKDLLVCLQQRRAKLTNADELNILYDDISKKYNYQPPEVNDHDCARRSPSEVIDDLLRYNYELHLLNDCIYKDLVTLETKVNDVMCDKLHKKEIQTSLEKDPNDLEAETGYIQEKNILAKQLAEARERQALQENTKLHAQVQSLLESHDDLKEKLEDAENLQGFSQSIVEEFVEERDALREKVMLLENRLQGESSLGECSCTAESVEEDREKTNKRLEEEDWKEQISVITRQKCEAKDRADYLKEQLMKAQSSHNIMGDLTEKHQQEADALRQRINILNERLQRNQTSLCKCFSKLFCPKRRRRHQEYISFLNRQKHDTKNRANELKEQLKWAQHIYNMYGTLIQNNCKKAEELRERMRILDDKLQGHQPSLGTRICRYLRLGRKSHKDEISSLIKQKHEAKKEAAVIKKELQEQEEIHRIYETLIQKLEEEEDDVYERKKSLDYKLERALNQRSLWKRVRSFIRPEKKRKNSQPSETEASPETTEQTTS